jgi:hypothetical protein
MVGKGQRERSPARRRSPTMGMILAQHPQPMVNGRINLYGSTPSPSNAA